MLDQLRVDKVPEEYILKRYTRNARQNATFDCKDYTQTAPDGSSMFCRRRLLVETSMDLSKRGVKTDRGLNRVLNGMRTLIEEVNVINEEEELENSKKNHRGDIGDEHKHEADDAALTVDNAILPPTCFKHKREKKGEQVNN